jgi:hypothetical protein
MSSTAIDIVKEPPSLGGLPVEARAVVGQLVMALRQEMAQHLDAVKVELRTLTNDNSILRQNLALLNGQMGDFQRLQVIPLREKLEHLTQELGSRMVENSTNLEQLIKALTETVAAKGGLIPEDLKARILDGRFEELDHVKAGDQVSVADAQAMIEEAYRRGREDAASDHAKGIT